MILPSSNNHCDPCKLGELPKASYPAMLHVEGAEVLTFIQLIASPKKREFEGNILGETIPPPATLDRHWAAEACADAIFNGDCDYFRIQDGPAGERSIVPRLRLIN